MTTLVAALALGWDGRAPEFQWSYANFRGLAVNWTEVPLITGSSFQYYEKGWKKGYYSSAWKPVDQEQLGNGQLQVRFNGDNGQVAGTHVYSPRPDGFDVDYQFRWRGDKPAMLEASFARLWAPLFAQGRLVLDGFDVGPLNRAVAASASFEQRLLGKAARVIEFEMPAGSVKIESDVPVHVMDARNYSVEWAAGQELFWIGLNDQEIRPQETRSYRLRWTFTPRMRNPVDARRIEVEAEPIANAVSPERTALPLIPQPKQVAQGEAWHAVFPEIEVEGEPELTAELREVLRSRWDFSTVDSVDGMSSVRARVGALGLKAEGYRLTVSAGGIEVVGQDREGLRHGMRTLAGLVQARGDRLAIRETTVTDWPSLSWRGVHMFVGPTARTFQSDLIAKVLGPLKLNKVVLQCERTNWEAIRGTETAITMDKADLAALAEVYRGHGFEVIPLVQSLGHAGWLFENRQNLDIALNPDVPFTLDPRKAKARDLLTSLWKEVAATLRPETVHFGLDEIDMRGLPDDPSFTTRLWTRHVPFLAGLAKEIGARPMIWGDIMLHSSEAPDAAHAKTLAEAKARRAVVPRGTMIADWHYKDDPDPSIYTSLRLFKSAGMMPVASTWYRPNNIRGSALAAEKVGGGLLQTTWAGYESSQANMVKAIDQFSAYVLAAEYAWSGREDLPSRLPYDAGEVLRRMYFAGPQVVRPLAGSSLGWGVGGRRVQIGPYGLVLGEAVGLSGVTHEEALRAPSAVSLALNRRGRGVVLAMDVLARVKETEEVARVTLHTAEGTAMTSAVLYGNHVRATTDSRPSLMAPRNGTGPSAVVVTLPDPGTIVGVTVESRSRAAGVRIHGATVY